MTTTGLWVYLSTTPLLWLTVTVLVWVVADGLATLSGRHPLVNPVLISIVVIGGLLALTGVDYPAYFNGAQFVHFLLGPATVALGIPLYRHRHLVRSNLIPMAVALVTGALVAIASAVLIGRTMGVPHDVLVSLAPKSITAGVAMAVSESLGGIPSLTASLVILTGVIGAIVVTPLMNALRIRNFAARGFAVGLASHGIGTARAFVVDPIAGTFAGIAMGLNAVFTPVAIPVLIRWLAP